MLSSASSSTASNDFLLLATDPEFRHRLETEPAKAFAEVGLQVDARDIPDEIRLPSVEQINEYLANNGNGKGGGKPDEPPKSIFWAAYLG